MGNCKSCIKPRTSDDLERPTPSTSEEQGPSGAEKGRESRAESSAAKRVSSAASRKSKNGSSQLTTTANQPLQPRQNHPEFLPPLNQDDKDVGGKVSSATRQRIIDSGSGRRKENVIHVRPAAGSDDYGSDEGRNLLNKLKSQYPVNSVKDICFILWEKDERLVHNKDYKFSRKKGLHVYLKESFYAEHPTYRAFRQLLQLYTSADKNTIRRESVEDEFLEQVMEKEVMQICWAFLNDSGYFSSDRSTFKNALRHIWFPSAFKHIFAGSRDEGGVTGLHNWLQFWLEKENMKDIECKKQIPQIMVHITFRWHGVLKDNCSMFVGTSPEFELALYTLLFFQTLREGKKYVTEEKYELNLGGKHTYDEPNVSVKVVVETLNSRKFLDIDKILITAYPIRPKRPQRNQA